MTTKIDNTQLFADTELRPVMGDSFTHRPNQRIELKRKDSVFTGLVWKNLKGARGVVEYTIDEYKGIIDTFQ